MWIFTSFCWILCQLGILDHLTKSLSVLDKMSSESISSNASLCILNIMASTAWCFDIWIWETKLTLLLSGRMWVNHVIHTKWAGLSLQVYIQHYTLLGICHLLLTVTFSKTYVLKTQLCEERTTTFLLYITWYFLLDNKSSTWYCFKAIKMTLLTLFQQVFVLFVSKQMPSHQFIITTSTEQGSWLIIFLQVRVQ